MVQMRVIYGLAMLMAATSMSGCVSNTFNGLSNQTTCTTTATAVNCIAPTVTTGTGTGATTTTTGTSTTTTPTVNTGNTATLVDGDTTIILEGSTVKSLVGAKPGVSALIDSPLNHVTASQTADQKIAFNTNTANNPNWPVAKTMSYNEYGTCIYDGGIDPNNPGKCLGGTGGHGLGADYKLYRYYQKGGFDEELQVWTWNQSYATQYRDVTASGIDPQHQAWSFGGNYTPAATVQTHAAADYVGTFGATAKTSNFIDPTAIYTVNAGGFPLTFSQTMSSNNNWRVKGTSALHADFGAGQFSGTLTSTDWLGVDKTGVFANVNVPMYNNNYNACVNQQAACNPLTPAGLIVFNNWVNYSPYFMSAKVKLAGSITTDPKSTTKPNQITGTASFDPASGIVTSAVTNPLYGGFFGANAQEVTGVFALDGAVTQPNDGQSPINNDRRGYIQMSGIFNGQ